MLLKDEILGLDGPWPKTCVGNGVMAGDSGCSLYYAHTQGIRTCIVSYVNPPVQTAIFFGGQM